MKRSYCARCGERVTTRMLEGRFRTVCPSCNAVFYENPLPVAASVLLDDRRRVLLVKRKREPYQGRWCLPMGFAETEETIASAALRELREETGIEAAAVQLLDADSYRSDHYGDLLIVTFEMEKTGGVERPGDDAQETRYFPLDGLPPLAFSSNEKALRACVLAHGEAWAIQDSFLRLQAGKHEALLSEELVPVIQEHASEIAKRWLADVRSKSTTASYREIDADRLVESVTLAISHFGRWLRGDEPSFAVSTFYRVLARERAEQGLRVHELLSALSLLKKHIWAFVSSQSVWSRPTDAYRVLELSRRVAMFFDKASYHAARAFEPAD